MSADEDDLELVKKAVSGDRPALERLLLDHCDRLSGHIQPKIPSSLQGVLGVEDVLQETFAQVFRDIERFEPQSSASFFAWLRSIADHRLQDCLRRLKRKKRGGDWDRIQRAADPNASSEANLVDLLFADGRTASQSIAGREALQAVRVAVAGLADDHRMAVRLRYLEGKSLAETAEAMGRTPAAVRGLLVRAKDKMREALGRASLYLSTK